MLMRTQILRIHRLPLLHKPLLLLRPRLPALLLQHHTSPPLCAHPISLYRMVPLLADLRSQRTKSALHQSRTVPAQRRSDVGGNMAHCGGDAALAVSAHQPVVL
jgi:hypothetical protein